MGVQGSTKGVPWEYKGVPWEYKGVPWEYKGVPWVYDGSTREYEEVWEVRKSRFFPLVYITWMNIHGRENQRTSKKVNI